MKVNSNGSALVLGLVLAGVALVLLQDPQCRGWCRTFARNLLSRGAGDFVTGLFA